MSLMTIIILISLVIAILLLFSGLFLSRKDSEPELKGDTPAFVEEIQGDAEAIYDFEKKPAGLSDGIHKMILQSSWGKKIARNLSRADIRLKPLEYLGMQIVAIAGLALLAAFLGGFEWYIILLGGVVGGFIPGMYLKSEQTRRLTKFDNQLPDMLNLMVNGLRAGYSNLQAMESISRELPAPISDEFRRVVQEVQLGVSVERALANLCKRIPSEDLDLIVTAMNVQREVGGNLSEILETISHTIRDRVRIKGEIRVLTTQAMYSGRFLSIMPVALMLLLFLADRSYIMEFFAPQNVPCGYIALGTVVIMITIGYLIMRKLAIVEV